MAEADDLPEPPDGADKPHYHGHRARLRRRFVDNGPESLADYELVEMLLFATIPRRDVKPIAKMLLDAHDGDLWALLNAPPDRLRRDFQLSEAAAVGLAVVGAAAKRMNRNRLIDRPVLSHWQALLDYCKGAMGILDVEQFRILFLNKRNRLIADEVQQQGTVDHTPVYLREVVKRALHHNASAMILVHNHPSGDTAPSREDIQMTREIVKAAAAVGVLVHDHVIVARDEIFSFKSNSLL